MSTPKNPLPKLLPKFQNSNKIVRDVFNGYDEVMNETYLPRWNGEDFTDYQKRLKGTTFTNFVYPIVDSLAGLVTRKPPTPINSDFDFSDIDGNGKSLHSFSKQIIKDSLIDGVSFVRLLSDSSKITFSCFKYSQLISYKIKQNKFVQMVFKEEVEVEKGQFESETLTRYLVYTPFGGELWYADKNGEQKKQEEWKNNLGYIPIFPIVSGKREKGLLIKSRLLDMAYLNVNHLNQNTNLSHILGIISNPIPIFYGAKTETDIKLNVTNGLRFDDKEAEGMEWVEVQGHGVLHL